MMNFIIDCIGIAITLIVGTQVSGMSFGSALALGIGITICSNLFDFIKNQYII